MVSVSFDEITNESPVSRIRATRTKLGIWGDYDKKERVVFRRSRFGRIKIEWKGHIPIETTEKIHCDLGHQHVVKQDKMWVWNYAEISKDDARAIAAFLLGQEQPSGGKSGA